MTEEIPATYPLPPAETMEDVLKAAPEPAPRPTTLVSGSGKGYGKGKFLHTETQRPITASEKVGLTFPVGRVHNHMKSQCYGQRISKGAAIFLTAVLEYMTSEVLQIAGERSRDLKRRRINPAHLLTAIQNDTEFAELSKGVTFSQSGGCVRNVMQQDTLPESKPKLDSEDEE